jgi:hypothetical protein
MEDSSSYVTAPQDWILWPMVGSLVMLLLFGAAVAYIHFRGVKLIDPVLRRIDQCVSLGMWALVVAIFASAAFGTEDTSAAAVLAFWVSVLVRAAATFVFKRLDAAKTVSTA